MRHGTPYVLAHGETPLWRYDANVGALPGRGAMLQDATTPLHFAAAHGRFAVALLLLEAGATTEAVDKEVRAQDAALGFHGLDG